jgi:hypothetical protein
MEAIAAVGPEGACSGTESSTLKKTQNMKTKTARWNILLAAIPLLAVIVTIQTARADALLYDNGPILGRAGYNFNGATYAIADSFSLGSGATVTSVDLGTWQITGDKFIGIDWSITTAPFGGSVLGSGYSSIKSSTFLEPYSGNPAWSIYSDIFAITPTALPAGNYWLQLDHAQTAASDPIGWDVSYGPSKAFHTAIGGIPSESFQLRGIPVPGAPAPPMTACLAFAAVLAMQALSNRKRTTI